MKLEKRYLIFIITLGLLLRLLFIIFATDLDSVNHFEYGAISDNLHHGNGYALYKYEDGKFNIGVTENGITYTSAFMPPLYTAVLYFFFFIKDAAARNFSILLFQSLVSAFLIYLIFNLTRKLFNINAALFASLITAILPEFIYSSSISGTTVLFQAGIILVFVLIYKLNNQGNSFKYPVIIGIIIGTLILLRSEVVVFVIILFAFLLMSKQIKSAFLIGITALLIIVPWQIRNLVVFKEFVPLSTSFGVNLYRGHNPYAIGQFSDKNIEEQRFKLKDDSNLELRMNDFLISITTDYIFSHPVKEFKYPFEKIFNLWLYNPDDPRTAHILYLFPWFALLILFILSLIKNLNWKNQKYILLFLIYFHIVVVIFFCLPRYQTMMKIALIPFAGEGIRFILSKMKLKV